MVQLPPPRSWMQSGRAAGSQGWAPGHRAHAQDGWRGSLRPVCTGLFCPLFGQKETQSRVQEGRWGGFSLTSSDFQPLPGQTSPERGWNFLFGSCCDPWMEFPGTFSVFSGVFGFFLISRGLGTESRILIMPRGSLSPPLSVQLEMGIDYGKSD